MNITLCKTEPRQHQIDGVEALMRRPYFMLAHEVGAGKSKIVVDASQVFWQDHTIDTVLVVAPAAARAVWANPNPFIGEVAKHGWATVPNVITEYSVKNSKLPRTDVRDSLQWVVTNYEFIRVQNRLLTLLQYVVNRKFWLVCDEAWEIKTHSSAQWKAVNKLRQLAARITLLNGTPIADDPLDLFAQMKVLHPSILGFKWFSHFRARYAILRPNVNFPMITGWQNLEELREKVAPYVLTKKTRDCFDLPPILEPITIEARLTPENWTRYKGQRDEMVSWLSIADDLTKGTASVTKQAIVKSMRLAQITSGFIGGVQEIDLSGEFLDFGSAGSATEAEPAASKVEEIGREKLEALLTWLEHLKPVPERLLVWCKFRLEVERTARALGTDGRRMHLLYGGQTAFEREEALKALNPDITPEGLVGVVGNPQAGGAGVNLAGASMAITLSQDAKLRVFLQKNGRIDRPGQRNPIRYVDVVATGPKGQRTIDHTILAALRGKEDVARWTMATWKSRLMEE